MGAHESVLVGKIQKEIKECKKRGGMSYFSILIHLRQKKMMEVIVDRTDQELDNIAFHSCVIIVYIPYKNKVKIIRKEIHGYDENYVIENVCKKIIKKIEKL